MKPRNLPDLAYNPLTAIGAALALVSGFTVLVLLARSLFFEKLHNPYIGIFLYVVLPAGLVLGLALIPVGMYRRWRRLKRRPATPGRGLPLIDLNRPSHRNAALVFLAGSGVFISLSAIGSYEAYHYSESVEFCGQTCHQVMQPEYTAYLGSPHARVPCSECHIGSGADWFVKAKLSGTYQVYATLADNYPRPIPTPIQNLRPAQETCEQCHWPEHFWGLQWSEYDHYMYDDENTPWPVTLLLKTGGGGFSHGQEASGIHWHMNIAAEVEYIARDPERTDIPWIRVTNRSNGEVTIYQNVDDPLSEEEIAAAEPRRMDCIDCHNRPTHVYYSPDESVDRALATGKIDAVIPSVKRAAVEALDGDYSSTEEAQAAIAESMNSFYADKHPEVEEGNAEDLAKAVQAVQEIYARTIFPAMKVRWDAYPDNIGHFRSPGCMRCHDNLHQSDDGRAIDSECDTCHTIVAQGSGERRMEAPGEEGLEFVHPEDLGEIWRETGCYECHTGTQP